MYPLSISNSKMERAGYQTIIKFLVRLTLFALPLFLIAATIEIAWWRAGDSWPAKRALAVQQRALEETLYGRAYFSQQFNLFKLAGIKYRRPAILAVGSSRVMQIRDFMFTPLEKDFYNAGGLLHNAYDVQWLANAFVTGDLPMPKVLIIGIDPWWLRADRGFETWLTDEDDVFRVGGHIEAFREIWKQGGIGGLISSSILASESPYFRYHAIGSAAEKYGHGFRKDGSLQYSPQMLLEYLKNPGYVDREKPPIIERIRRYRSYFTVPVILDKEKIRIIFDSLSLLQKTEIEMHVFMPPVSSEVLKALDQSVELSKWWQFYKNDMPGLLKKRGMTVIPVAQPAHLGLSDLYMIDGFHASEVYMAKVVRMIIENIQHPSYLKSVDLEKLSYTIENAAIPLAFEIPGQDLTVSEGNKRKR